MVPYKIERLSEYPMNNQGSQYRSVLVTGAEGYIGKILVELLAQNPKRIKTIIATDIIEPTDRSKFDNIQYITLDIRDKGLVDIMKERAVDVVVHLAAIVTPGKKTSRELEYSIDVLGTKNVLESCLTAGVKKIIYSSSGAVYGYYPDNPEWLDEEDRIRGNPEFSYSDHKRQVEEMLLKFRKEHPELEQLIFRPGTILGKHTSNQITDLFDKRIIMGLKGAPIPFVLIWDEDVVRAILKGLHEEGNGIYNMAGDGILTMKEMAGMMRKSYVSLPVWLVRGVLWIMKQFHLTQYGPEQVDFLRYRPVLSNSRLKEKFGYIPKKSTIEVFEYFLESRQAHD